MRRAVGALGASDFGGFHRYSTVQREVAVVDVEAGGFIRRCARITSISWWCLSCGLQLQQQQRQQQQQQQQQSP